MITAKTTSCRKCKGCEDCYDLGVEKVRQYLNGIDFQISQYNQSYISIKDWGFACNSVTKEEFEKLIIFKEYLEHYSNALRLGYDSGMCDVEIQYILEATSKLITIPKGDVSKVKIDNSNFDLWVTQNPYCVAWEDWEKSMVRVCPKIGFEVSNVSQACNLIWEIQTEQIENNCKFLYTLSVASEAIRKSCFDVHVENLATCKMNYEFMVSQHNCDLNFETYVTLLNCNLSHKVITNLLECGVRVSYNDEKQTPQISTKDHTYLLTDININILKNNLDGCALKTVFGVEDVSLTNEEVESLIKSYSTPIV